MFILVQVSCFLWVVFIEKLFCIYVSLSYICRLCSLESIVRALFFVLRVLYVSVNYFCS